jgi:hypothetical protein
MPLLAPVINAMAILASLKLAYLEVETTLLTGPTVSLPDASGVIPKCHTAALPRATVWRTSNPSNCG